MTAALAKDNALQAFEQKAEPQHTCTNTTLTFLERLMIRSAATSLRATPQVPNKHCREDD